MTHSCKLRLRAVTMRQQPKINRQHGIHDSIEFSSLMPKGKDKQVRLPVSAINAESCYLISRSWADFSRNRTSQQDKTQRAHN